MPLPSGVGFKHGHGGELPGDDYAGNACAVISRRMFDQFCKGPYVRLIRLIKEHSPHIKVTYHSDGAMTAVLPRIIEIGADIFHSTEPLPAWDLAEMKSQFGACITFMGGVHIEKAMLGSTDDVIQEAQLRIRELGAEGGYILAPSNHLQWDVPPQNLFTLYDGAQV